MAVAAAAQAAFGHLNATRLRRLMQQGASRTQAMYEVVHHPGPFFLGSDDGLRGYLINEFDGQRLARGNFEIRSIPKPLWFLRVSSKTSCSVTAGTCAVPSRVIWENTASFGLVRVNTTPASSGLV